MNNPLILSNLPHTWILDLDGTIVKHNGYLIDGEDSFLPGAEEFLKGINKEDMIVILTSRKIKYKELTEAFLANNNIRYNHIIYEVNYGERVLINDNKPSGLCMAYAYNLTRDNGIELSYYIDKSL